MCRSSARTSQGLAKPGKHTAQQAIGQQAPQQGGQGRVDHQRATAHVRVGVVRELAEHARVK